MDFKTTVYNRVVMTGTLTDFGKGLEVKDMISPTGWVGLTFELGLNIEENGVKNIQGIKFFGGLNQFNKESGFPIKWENGVAVEKIAYNDRHNAEKLAALPYGKAKIIKANGVTSQFLCEKEFVESARNIMPSLLGKRVTLMGEMESRYYNGVTYQKMVVSSLEVLEEGSPVLDKCDGQIQYFFDSNSLDQSIFSGNGVKFDQVQELAALYQDKIVLPVYVLTNNMDKDTKKDVPKVLIPTEVIISTAKIDWTNPIHKKMITLLLKTFKCEDTDKVYTVGYKNKYFSGYSDTELTEEELVAMFSAEELETMEFFETMTPGYKENAINLKTKTKKGDRVSETKLIQPHESTMIVSEAIGITQDALSLYKTIFAMVQPSPSNSVSAPNADNITNPTDFANIFS